MKNLRLTEQQFAERKAGKDCQPPRPYEREVQDAALKLCKHHPSVAWLARMNTGAMQAGERFVRFGFPGLSDLLGQTTDGLIIAIEVKRPGEKPTAQQQEFLNIVAINKGVSGCAHSAQEAWDILEMATV